MEKLKERVKNMQHRVKSLIKISADENNKW